MLGLLAGLGISSQRLGLINLNPATEQGPGPSAELAGNLGFLFAFTMPFALALLALQFRNSSWRAAVWLGVALLALVAAFMPLSVVICLSLPLPALLLVFAAILTLGESPLNHRTRVLVIAVGLAIAGGVAGIALFSLPDAQCWLLVQQANGQEAWQVVPYTNSLTLGPAPGPVAGTCSSDIISPLEAVMSGGMWAITLIGLALVLPRALPRDAEK